MLTNSFCDVATSLPIREASADRREPSNDSKSIAHVPLDEGWAWVVLIGALYVSVTLLGIGMSFGIIFSDPLIAMGSSSTLNAWIFNFHYFMWHCSTVFSGALCSSFGWRPVSFIGYGVTSISFMLMTFVTTPLHIFMLFSIIVGIAGGLSTTVVLLIVPAYFDKYKGGALSSLSVGVAMSMFIIPPLIRFLIDEYSFKGACLIFGAILLNCCVGALLFRPLNCNSDGTILTANSDLNDSVKSAKWRRILPVLKTSLNNLKHLKQLRLLIITLSFSTFMMTYGNFSGQFPFAMIERGYSTSYAPWCISLSAITSTFVRIIVTLVSDRKWFSRKYGYISGLVISGLSTSVVYLVINNLSMVLVAMVFWGAGTALVLSTYFALIIDICGRELYTPGVSATGLFLGTLSLIIGPFFGLIRDTSSYAWSMGACGIVQIICALMWLLMPYAVKMDANNTK